MSLQEHIDRFLSNKMSVKERLEFEQLLQQNPELLKEVEEAKQAIQKLKDLERFALKKRLQEIESRFEKNENIKKSNPLIWILILVSVMSTGLWFWYWNQKNNSIPTAPFEVQTKPDLDQKIDTIHIDTTAIAPPIHNENNTEKNKKEKTISKEKREEIFAAHFEPYTDDDIEYEVRSNQDKSPFELYKHYYINAKFDKVLVVFENLDQNLKNDEQVLFIKANTYMAQKNINQALHILQSLEKNKSTSYSKEIQWYLALCYIQKDELNRAKKILNDSEKVEPTRSKKLLGKL